MTLRIVSGRAGSGKSTFIHEEMIHDLKNDVLGYPIYMIVPDQMSFSTEYDLTNNYNIEGMMRAQVLTFKRFAWMMLQQTGGIAKDKIDQFGYRMMIRQILDEHKSELVLFRQAAGKNGFTQEVEMLLREFSQYDITSETLPQLIEELEKSQATNTLVAKLKDFQVIVKALEERLGDSYVDGESFYPIVVEQLQNIPDFKDSHVYIDGFVR
ncbi:MAG: helicase-exonuclease AddAB subunit AddB, partial [Lysinibacillus sp.]